MMKKLNGLNTLDNITLGPNTKLDKNIIFDFAKASLYQQSSDISSGNTIPFSLGISRPNSDLQPTNGSKIINVSNRNIEVIAFGKANLNSASTGGGNVIDFSILQNDIEFAFPANYKQRNTGVASSGSYIHLFTSMAPGDSLSMKLNYGFSSTSSNAQLICTEDNFSNFANQLTYSFLS